MNRVAALPAAVPAGHPARVAVTLVELPGFGACGGFAATKDLSLEWLG